MNKKRHNRRETFEGHREWSDMNCGAGSSSLELEPPSQSHDAFGIVLLRDLSQSRNVITVDALQGGVGSGVVVVHRHFVKPLTLLLNHEFF